jgi:hypothetical protein
MQQKQTKHIHKMKKLTNNKFKQKNKNGKKLTKLEKESLKFITPRPTQIFWEEYSSNKKVENNK